MVDSEDARRMRPPAMPRPPSCKLRRLLMPCVIVLVGTVYFHLHHSQWQLSSGSRIINSLAGNSSPSPPLPLIDPNNDSNNLRIATWNLRVPFPPDLRLNLSWAERRRSVASAIAEWRPHLLALQEDCYFMTQDLMNMEVAHKIASISEGLRERSDRLLLSDIYHRYGLFNRNGGSVPASNWPENAFSPIVGRDGEHNSVWYDKERLGLMRNVTFWLSSTPTIAGGSFGEVTGRVANCVLVRDRLCVDGDGTKNHGVVGNAASMRPRCPSDVFYCSTHFPAGNATRQLWSVDVLTEMFSEFHDQFSRRDNKNAEGDEKLLMMVAGDFNSDPGSDTYNAMVKAGFVDSRQLSREGKAMEEYTNTTNDWHGGRDSLIDYVWIYQGKNSGGDNSRLLGSVAAVRHVHIPCCCDPVSPSEDPCDRTASDHLMVMADFSIA